MKLMKNQVGKNFFHNLVKNALLVKLASLAADTNTALALRILASYNRGRLLLRERLHTFRFCHMPATEGWPVADLSHASSGVAV